MAFNVRKALRTNAVAAKENQQFVQDEAWHGANSKGRPVAIGRYTVELNINGERPAAQTDKRTAQMPSCSVESC